MKKNGLYASMWNEQLQGEANNNAESNSVEENVSTDKTENSNDAEKPVVPSTGKVNSQKKTFNVRT